jgi:anti-anti-sigma regulatory factor
VKHAPINLTTFEIVGSAVLIRMVHQVPDSEYSEGFWDRFERRWIVTETGQRFVSYPEGFWNHFEELRNSGHRRFVLDISEVDLDAERVLEAIVEIYKRVREMDGWLGFVATGKVNDLLSLTQLGEVCPTFDNREDALAAAESEG